MKKRNNNINLFRDFSNLQFKIMDSLLFLLFVIIIVSTILIAKSNVQLNSKLENTISYFEKQNPIFINLKNIKNKASFRQVGNYLIVLKDSSFIEDESGKISSVVGDLKDAKKSFMDGSIVSYFLQILDFFIIGLGLFILGKNQNLISDFNVKSKDYEDRINKLFHSQHLYHMVECINNCSLSLKKDENCIVLKRYRISNLKNCHQIMHYVDEITSYLDENNGKMVYLDGKEKTIRLLDDILLKMKVKNLSQIEGYYSQVYKELEILKGKVIKIKTDIP